jgi:glycosyltransferase involved in cell wall biosynthesis
MRREGFDIVHTHTPKPGLLGQLAARLAGVPVVVKTLHGFYFHDGMRPAWRRFYIFMERIAALCSDLIFSQNREDVETSRMEKICPSSKIKYLGVGIDVKRFDPAAVSRDEIRRRRAEVGVRPGGAIIGFVGRLVREKGILELLAAGRLVREKLPDVRFLFIGPVDPEKDDALGPAIASQFGLADVCSFTGMREDMPELYALMDLFVLPSHREGLPRVLMEAAAMGIPSVATDIRGCREVVRHGRNGLLVPLGDVEALAGAILQLLTDRDLARRLGQEARRVALDEFDERKGFEAVKAEYQRLLAHKGLREALNA